MHPTFYVPPRFSPLHSLLGQAIRWLVRDQRQAGGVYLIVVSSLILLGILGQFVSWTWMAPQLATEADARIASRFFWVQLSALALFLAMALLGVAPAVRVVLREHGIEIRQGSRRCHVLYDTVQRCEAVDALHFHRIYRPYECVQPFISRATPQILLLDTGSSIVGVGLESKDLTACKGMLMSCALARGCVG